MFAGGAAAYAAHYVNAVAGNMALDEQELAELDGVLAAAVDTRKQPFYALVVGSDKWETYGERSDALVLVRIDPSAHTVTMVSVPRDTPYELNGATVKINQAFAEQGAAGAISAVQELTGVEISYYAEIEFDGFASFVDSLGGVYVDVPYAIDYQVYTRDRDPVHIEAGSQLLDGTECVALARMRTAYGDNQDATRQSNVRALAVALLKDVLQAPPSEMPGLVQRLTECIATNMELPVLVSLATDFARAESTTVYTCTGPSEGDIDEDTGLWLCYENPEGWKALMESVDAGNDPEALASAIESGQLDPESEKTQA